jgi:hypothetical protein
MNYITFSLFLLLSFCANKVYTCRIKIHMMMMLHILIYKLVSDHEVLKRSSFAGLTMNTVLTR